MTATTCSMMIVKMDLEKYAKLNFGGFRDKRTGVEYRNAVTQTTINRKANNPMRNKTNSMRATRDTQTRDSALRGCQAFHECGIQTKGKGLHFDERKDKEIFIRPSSIYLDSDMLRKEQIKDAQVIQNRWRGYMTRRRYEMMKSVVQAKKEENIEHKSRREQISNEKRQREIHRRLNPKTCADFETLYTELDAWRDYEQDELYQKQKMTTSTTAKKKGETIQNRKSSSNGTNTTNISGKQQKWETQQQRLLSKEIILLRKIESLKRNAIKHHEKKCIKRSMETMSRPKKWEIRPDEREGRIGIMEVETPFTNHARSLKEMYEKLNDCTVDDKERLLTLLIVRQTIHHDDSEYYDCILTRDISDLIDRETDMLNRGRTDKDMLSGLRLRLSNLFLQFVFTPEFNPECESLSRDG